VTLASDPAISEIELHQVVTADSPSGDRTHALRHDDCFGLFNEIGDIDAETRSGDITITADPNGKFLLVGNQSSPGIQVFRLNSGDGTLSSVSTYSVGNAPTSIVVTQ